MRRVVGAALLLPLLVLAMSFAHDQMRCRLTGVVLQTCACPDGQPGGPAAADAQSCCERRTVEAFTAGRQETPSSSLPAPDAVATRMAARAGFAARPVLSPVRDLRPPGPPLVLLKQSFLI